MNPEGGTPDDPCDPARHGPDHAAVPIRRAAPRRWRTGRAGCYVQSNAATLPRFPALALQRPYSVLAAPATWHTYRPRRPRLLAGSGPALAAGPARRGRPALGWRLTSGPCRRQIARREPHQFNSMFTIVLSPEPGLADYASAIRTIHAAFQPVPASMSQPCRKELPSMTGRTSHVALPEVCRCKPL